MPAADGSGDPVARTPVPLTAAGVAWSVRVRDLCHGTDALVVTPERVLPTASVAKLFLLAEVAERVADGRMPGDHPLERRAVPAVADSGLWQHMAVDRLAVADAALLVAAVSDNLATNVLLDALGPAPAALDALAARAAALGARASRLLDRVRDERGPADPPTLSVGTADDWVRVLSGIDAGTSMSARARELLLGWLGHSCDLSMVAAGLRLDPLAHGPQDGTGIRLWHKTGSDPGTRADVGLVRGRHTVAYAAIARWEPGASAGGDPLLPAVLDDLHDVGRLVAGLAGAD